MAAANHLMRKLMHMASAGIAATRIPLSLFRCPVPIGQRRYPIQSPQLDVTHSATTDLLNNARHFTNQQRKSPEMMMIKILEGFPDNVIAASTVGRVTRQDYEAVLIPRVEETAKKHSKIRCYYEIGADFSGMEPGAVWEDFRVGVEYWTRWERVAVVTDVTWIAHVVSAFRFLMPGQIRVFPTSEKETARAWVGAP